MKPHLNVYAGILAAAQALETELNKFGYEHNVRHERTDITSMNDEETRYLHEITVTITEKIK